VRISLFPDMKLVSGPQLKENMMLWSTNPTYALSEFHFAKLLSPPGNDRLSVKATLKATRPPYGRLGGPVPAVVLESNCVNPVALNPTKLLLVDG
jgi:hypothetical protein